MLLGPRLSLTVHSVSKVQMNMVESTAQVDNIVVGVMTDVNINALIKVVNKKPFMLRYLGQQKLYDKHTFGVVDRLDAYRDYLFVFTTDDKAYVIKHLGNGSFTRPYPVHFGDDAGAIEYAKLVRNQKGKTMVVASCENVGVSARAVSYKKTSKRIQLVEAEVATPLSSAIQDATCKWKVSTEYQVRSTSLL